MPSMTPVRPLAPAPTPPRVPIRPNAPVDYSNLTNTGWHDLFQGMGIERYGDAPTASILNQRIAPGLGHRVLSQIGFGNSLEPQRQNLIRNALRMMSPGNMMANADRMRARGVNAAISQAPQTDFAMRQLGLGTGARGGAVQAGINQANTQANDHLAYLFSPEGQQAAMQMMLGMIGQGQGSDLGSFLDVNSASQNRELMRHQTGTAGGQGGMLGGMLGQLAGLALPYLLPGPGGMAAGAAVSGAGRQPGSSGMSSLRRP